MNIFRTLTCLLLVEILFGCTRVNPKPSPNSGEAVQLPNGETVLLAKQATKEEIERWNLSLKPGDSAYCFMPMGLIIGSHGICILRNGKIVEFKYTAHSL